MSLKEFKKFNSKTQDLNEVQQNVFLFGAQFNKEVLDGILLTSVAIGTSTTSIPHKLRRKFQGWHLVDIQGDARVWRDATVTSDLDKFLPLKASASVTVNLWVF